MKFAHGLSAMLIGAAVVVVQPQQAVALTPVQVEAISKEFTVQIGGDGLGSGVIFERKGDTYKVLTNRHVVSDNGRYEIQTADGSRYPVYSSQEIPGLDLAVLQFTSKRNYRTANLGNSNQIRQKMTVYVGGWSTETLPGTDERSYLLIPGSFLRRDPKSDQGYALVYSNQALPGMSGGSVLDENGRVLGINGRALQEPNVRSTVRMGIPINTFLTARNNSRTSTPTITAPQPTVARPLRPTTTPTTATAPRQRTAEDFISLGGAKAKRKNYSGAIADYNKAIQINPNNPDVYFQRGFAYRTLKNYQAALKDYNQGLRLNPNNKFAYLERGGIHIRLKDYKGAITDGDQVIRLVNTNDSFGKIMKNEGYMLQGSAYQMQKDYRGALAAYEKAIAALAGLERANSLSLPAVNKIGLVKYELGDLLGAIRQFQAAINIDTRLVEPQLALATTLYTQGERERGLAIAEAALRSDRRFADVKVLKEKLWGDRILADAQKLPTNPKIRYLADAPRLLAPNRRTLAPTRGR